MHLFTDACISSEVYTVSFCSIESRILWFWILKIYSGILFMQTLFSWIKLLSISNKLLRIIYLLFTYLNSCRMNEWSPAERKINGTSTMRTPITQTMTRQIHINSYQKRQVCTKHRWRKIYILIHSEKYIYIYSINSGRHKLSTLQIALLAKAWTKFSSLSPNEKFDDDALSKLSVSGTGNNPLPPTPPPPT